MDSSPRTKEGERERERERKRERMSLLGAPTIYLKPSAALIRLGRARSRNAHPGPVKPTGG